MIAGTKYRLVTRSDFDGLVCAVLLKELNMIDEIIFVHPKDMQDGKIDVTERDIISNLPFVDGVYLAFDHHESETIRNKALSENHIIDPTAPSAARVIYNFFDGDKKFPAAWRSMISAVDKADSAQFTLEEVLNPKGWVLLNYIMDPRTGLGRFKDFEISNYDLMLKLIDYCRNHKIDEIMQIDDVQERVELYLEQSKLFKEQIKRCSKVYGNVVVLDLRDEETIFAGNRFMIYALYPQCNISIHVIPGLKKQNTVFAIGNSIINRTSKTNIGTYVLEFGGGGHKNAGTCQIENDQADDVLNKLIIRLTVNG